MKMLRLGLLGELLHSPPRPVRWITERGIIFQIGREVIAVASGENLLAEAKEIVYNNRNTDLQRIKTSAWYTARKKLLHVPRNTFPQLLSAAISKIPLIGGAFSSVTSFIAEKKIEDILNDRKKNKLAKYNGVLEGGVSSSEALRKCAKWEAKTLPELVEKIGSNLPKLRDAHNVREQKLKKFNDSPFDEAAVSDALKAIVNEEHYINKISLKVRVAQDALSKVENHLIDAMADNKEMQIEAVKLINYIESRGMVSNPLYENPSKASQAMSPSGTPSPVWNSNPLFRPPPPRR